MNEILLKKSSYSIPDGIHQLKKLDISCNIISSKVKRYDVKDFTSYIPHTTTKEIVKYIVAPDWHNWFRKNLKNFVRGYA